MAKELTFGFIAEPVRCHACAAIEREGKRWSQLAHKGQADLSGLRFSVVRADEQLTD